MAEMNQWEYQALSMGSFWNTIKSEDLEAALNELGEEGWEVISVYTQHGTNRTIVVAKRPLTADTRRRRSWPG